MARSFNGTTSDAITADGANVFADLAPCSFAYWINGAAQSTRCAFSEGINNAGWQFFLGTSTVTPFNTTHLQIIVNSATRISVNGTAVILDSTWHHVCATFDSSRNIVVYADGASDITGSYSPGGFTGIRVGIGCLRRTSNGNEITGSLAHVASWSRTLSAKEALMLANGLPPSHLGADHYWPLWGVDSPEPDIGTASHVAGTVTGTAAVREGRVSPDLLTV